MCRVQLSLNVTDFDAAVTFYSRLFRTEPAKLYPGYANFAASPGRRPCSASGWTAASRPLPASSSSGGSPGPAWLAPHRSCGGPETRRDQLLSTCAVYRRRGDPRARGRRPRRDQHRRARAHGGHRHLRTSARDSQTADRRAARKWRDRREGTQNLLCAYLAIAVFAGLANNTLFGAWWLDGAVALGIAGWAVVEGRRAWAGRSCGCASQPGACC